MTGDGAGFWAWSNEVYGRERVAAMLLDLQDRFGLNVNLVLWCGWCAALFDDIPETIVAKALEVSNLWTSNVTAPLRQARRALRTPPRELAADAAALRSEVKDIELKSERLEQEMLAALAAEALSPAPDAYAANRAKRNLARYIELAGVARGKGWSAETVDALAEKFYSNGDARRS